MDLVLNNKKINIKEHYNLYYMTSNWYGLHVQLFQAKEWYFIMKKKNKSMIYNKEIYRYLIILSNTDIKWRNRLLELMVLAPNKITLYMIYKTLEN